MNEVTRLRKVNSKMRSKAPDSLVKIIGVMAKQSQKLARQAVTEYSCEVEAIINGQCRDANRIEHLLDYMLDFAFDGQMLVLYKKLCRYLYGFNPAAAVAYVGYYRELWDTEVVATRSSASITTAGYAPLRRDG